MYTVRKRSKEMCIGHRLLNYEGACKNVHGHNIVVEIELQSPMDRSLDLTVDFMQIHKFLNNLDGLWDHGFLVNEDDGEMIDFLRAEDSKFFEVEGNPTMEKLAFEAFRSAMVFWPSTSNVTIVATRVYEKDGDNCAEYRPDVQSR